MTRTEFRPFRCCMYRTAKHYEAWKPSKYLKTGSYLTENTLHVHYTDKRHKFAEEIIAVVKMQEF